MKNGGVGFGKVSVEGAAARGADRQADGGLEADRGRHDQGPAQVATQLSLRERWATGGLGAARRVFGGPPRKRLGSARHGASSPLVLEMRGITKRFPGIVANDDVSFDLRRGEVHALLGENGAGKSTLMNILYGLYHPDEGEIVLKGKPVRLGSAREAIEHGIGMVHQHFMLIPVMTVAENIVLAQEPTRGGVLLDFDAADRRARELSSAFNFAIDPDERVENITVGQQQRVEILKALYRSAEMLVLDEPTAVLTPQEAKELFEILRTLQREGMSIIFISHKLNEVLDIADRITVLRRGKVDRDAAGSRRDRGEPRPADGRPRGAPPRREGARAAGRAAARGRGPPRRSTTAASRRCAASRSRCAPARSSASPASTATGRRS